MNSRARLTVATFVDIGNTNVKILDRTVKTSGFDIVDFFNHDDFVISSVVPRLLEETMEKLKKENKTFMIIGRDSNFSFEHSHIDGVGIDLLLAAEGALTISKPPVCVVAAGTAAVTLFVSLKNGKAFYEGGVIMPGFGLQTEILNQRTAQLPKIGLTKPKSFLGSNTKDAINSGVCIGVTKGIEAVISGVENQLGIKFNKLFATGGDGKFLKDNSELNFEHIEDLVFRGMKNIYSKRGETK